MRKQVRKLVDYPFNALRRFYRVSARPSALGFSIVYAILAASWLSIASAMGASPAPRAPPAFTGIAKQCNDAAWERIRATGRAYNVARAGFDEKTGVSDVWIGKHLFRVPKGYVNFISPGSTEGMPGISAVLVAVLPEMKVGSASAPELITADPPVVQILIRCDPAEYATVGYTASRTREHYLSIYLRTRPASLMKTLELPALDLIGYKSEARTTVYFPKDVNVRNVHGGVLAMRCDEPYPVSGERPRPLCHSTFALRDGVFVEYQFPERFLKYWNTSYANVVRLLNSFLLEK